ncbi:MAG: hypothetical protein EOP49_20325 [Sphingobacteriales bacterium]|nr:MAG: hypothetical protein EOP49_20325 [Sphingobacteriales bacterium]
MHNQQLCNLCIPFVPALISRDAKDAHFVVGQALGENIFTNGKSTKNLQLKKGESVTFRYRIIVDQASKALSPTELNAQADAFASKPGM